MSSFTHYIETSPDVEIAVTVHYDYSPAERMTWNHPGCSDSVDVYQIDTRGQDVVITDDERERIAEIALENAREKIAEERDTVDDFRVQEARERMVERRI